MTLEIEYTTQGSLNPDAATGPNVTGPNAKVPNPKVPCDRTIQFLGQDIVEAWTRYRTSR